MIIIFIAFFRYSWWKNNTNLLDPGAATIQETSLGGGSDSGLSVRIDPLTSADEGYYFCMASNDFGTATSESIYLEQAVLGSYPAGMSSTHRCYIRHLPLAVQISRVWNVYRINCSYIDI